MGDDLRQPDPTPAARQSPRTQPPDSDNPLRWNVQLTVDPQALQRWLVQRIAERAVQILKEKQG